MIADRHATRTTSGFFVGAVDSNPLGLISAFHAKADDASDFVFNIRDGSGGTIVIPIALKAQTPGAAVGNAYEHPLQVTAGQTWYLEIVSGSGRVGISGR